MSSSPSPVRIGIVGCGIVAELKHLVVLKGVPGAQVVAAADPDRTALQRVADAFGIEHRHHDARALADNPCVDAVAVFTPPAEHEAAVVAALEAGKHVFVEKPLALDVAACDRMIAHARANSMKAMVGFHMRFHRQSLAARAMIESNDLGPIELIRSIWTNPIRIRRPLPGWRERRETGGGVLIELGVHQYDLWRYLVGSEVEEIFAAVHSRQWPDESATLSGRLKSGVLVSSVLSEVTGHDMEFEIYGREGRLRLGCLRYDGLEHFAADDTPGGMRATARRLLATVARLPEAYANGSGGDYIASYRNEWLHFLDCVRHDRPVGCSLEDGRHAVAVAIAAVQSAASGVPVRVEQAVEASAFAV